MQMIPVQCYPGIDDDRESMTDRNGVSPMENLDNYVDREFRQKQSRDQRRRSDAEYRLYWFTHQRFIERHAQAFGFGKDLQALMGLNRLLGSVRKWWTEHITSDRRIGDQESQTHF